ncbi:hypothetical protein [Aurantiacibacter gilvus]|uniref:DUF2927 domain-containing protein n=1 Tax=Aurantiacibacter gilvus TaxID=3139141 RepID=A0ABU9IA99_9SPHN
MTLSARFTLVAAAAALSLPAPLVAQQEVPSAWDEEGNEIVVTGNNEDISVVQVQRQVRDIVVRQGNLLDSPLARFEDRLCPGVVGLSGEFAYSFNARLRANAEELGIRLLDDDCEPNFVVAFVDDGEAMFRRMMRDEPQNFQYLNSGEKNDILEPGPVHVWTSVQPRTLTGMPIAQVRDLMNPPRMGVHAAHTRIYTATRNDIVSVMLSFDRDAVQGMSLRQLADYATIRGLAQTRPPEDPVMDSILTLFDAESPPLGLTEFDRAYLRSLYDDIPNLPGFRRVGGTTRQLRLMAEESARESASQSTANE